MKNTEKMKLSLSQALTAAPIIFLAIKGCTLRPSHLPKPLMYSMKPNYCFILLNRGNTLRAGRWQPWHARAANVPEISKFCTRAALKIKSDPSVSVWHPHSCTTILHACAKLRRFIY